MLSAKFNCHNYNTHKKNTINNTVFVEFNLNKLVSDS